MTITLCVFILSSRFFPLTFEENTVPYETPPRGSDTPVASFGGARRPAEPPVIRRSGKSATSPNRDFQLQTSRGNNAHDARPPHAAPAHFNRRPTSEVGRLLLCCTSTQIIFPSALQECVHSLTFQNSEDQGILYFQDPLWGQTCQAPDLIVQIPHPWAKRLPWLRAMRRF